MNSLFPDPHYCRTNNAKGHRNPVKFFSFNTFFASLDLPRHHLPALHFNKKLLWPTIAWNGPKYVRFLTHEQPFLSPRTAVYPPLEPSFARMVSFPISPFPSPVIFRPRQSQVFPPVSQAHTCSPPIPTPVAEPVHTPLAGPTSRTMQSS